MFLFVETLFFYYLFCGREEARGEKGRVKGVDYDIAKVTLYYDIIAKVTLYSSSTGVILNGQVYYVSSCLTVHMNRRESAHSWRILRISAEL